MLLQLALICLWLGAGMAAAQAVEKDGERKIGARDLPAAVQAASADYVRTKAAGAAVKGYARETEEGKTFYEVELRIQGKTRDVTFEPDGKLFAEEQEVELASLPAAAQEALKKAAGKNRVTLVESITKGGQQYYEAHIRRGLWKEDEVKVNAAGEKLP